MRCRHREHEVLFTALDIETSKRRKDAKTISQEKKSDSSASDVIKTFIGSLTTDFTMVLKRVTDRQVDPVSSI